MQLLDLPEPSAPVLLRLQGEDRLSDEAYWDFCTANPDLRIERTAEGEIVIVPPGGSESSYRNAEAAAQLGNWTKRDGRGKAFESSVQFFLPDGSALSPDAAWVSNESLNRFSKLQRKKFMHLVPEFIVEVMSPSDHLKQAKAKMEQWISNGVELGWLIDGDARTLYIYRRGHPVITRRRSSTLSGEGPVKGFILELDSIWEGL